LNFYKGILPVLLGVTIVYFTRFIVKLLLRRNFTSDHFILWQLVGDVKVASLILGYQFLQKTYSGFIVTELLSLSIIYLSSIFLVSIYGLEGL
jgi:PST family polysaccharide transporter